MPAPIRSPSIVRFGAYEARLGSGELYKDGHRIKLQDQPFQVLALLLERPGELVTREELRQKLWPTDTFVDFDTGLNSAIKRLRDALNDSADEPRYIETLPRRGYRFIYPVNGLAPVQTGAAPEAVPALQARLRRRAIWMVAGIVAAALVTAGYFAREGLWSGAQPPARRVMLAVLPFENLSGDPEQEYFSDGLTEEMITELGRLQPEGLGVIARTSAMQYKKKGGDVRRIARELGVDYILEGSVRREGGRVRISAQLVAARDQTHLWAESYERDLAGVFTVQKDVARALSQQIQLKLTPQQQERLARGRPVNPEAHAAYLKGRYFFDRPQTGHKAAEYFQQAINIDPGYAPAYAGLADAYLWTSFGEILLPPREWYGKARAAAMKAVELDPSLAEAHASLAGVGDFQLDYWDFSLREYQRAIELNPNYANAHAWYAQHLAIRGRHQEAEAEIKRAEELDPLSLFIKTQVGWIYLWAGQIDRAMEQWQRVVELDPNFPLAHYNLGMGYDLKAKYPEAIAAYRKALTLQDFTYTWLMLGHAYAMAGEEAEARKILAKMKERTKREYVPPVLWAEVHLALGEKEQALDWLEKGYQDGDPLLANIKLEPFWWQPLRDEPRFQALLRRLNLPGPWLENYPLLDGAR